MSPSVDVAARYLATWQGAGMAWHADVEWVSADHSEDGESSKLQVVKRGRLVEGAARSIRGSGRVQQQRQWSRAGGKVVIPKPHSGADIGAALAMAKLDGPLEAILLLVCCEDLAQWPIVLRYGLACMPHPHATEALTDAMHRIMWRRPAMALEARAKALGVRRQSYATARKFAEDTLLQWLAQASEGFLEAMH